MKVRRRAYPLFPNEPRGKEDTRRNHGSPRPSGSHVPRMRVTEVAKAIREAIQANPATTGLPKMPPLYTRSELTLEDTSLRDQLHREKWAGVGPYDGRVKAGKMTPAMAAMKAKTLEASRA